MQSRISGGRSGDIAVGVKRLKPPFRRFAPPESRRRSSVGAKISWVQSWFSAVDAFVAGGGPRQHETSRFPFARVTRVGPSGIGETGMRFRSLDFDLQTLRLPCKDFLNATCRHLESFRVKIIARSPFTEQPRRSVYGCTHARTGEGALGCNPDDGRVDLGTTHRNTNRSEGEIDRQEKVSRIPLLIRLGCIVGETEAGHLLLSPTLSDTCGSLFNPRI
jgi:hypothetical protein